MDNPGWHAQRRAQKEQDAYNRYYNTGDGRYQPVEQVGPMSEFSIGGPYHKSPSPPPLPPRNHSQLTHMTPVERSQLQEVPRMDPPLQFMCGPLLKYDTVVDNVWYGAALIVTADSGSKYEPSPFLTYEWDPDQPPPKRSRYRQPDRVPTSSFELGLHPADPHSTNAATLASNYGQRDAHTANEMPLQGPNVHQRRVDGQEIFVYVGPGGSFTFWRFYIEIPLSENEVEVTYCINFGQKLEFFVPGRHQNLRWAAHSCNGFSAGINPDDFRGPGFKSGYDPLWVDLLMKHAEEPFHVLVGAYQLLARLMHEPEMQCWVNMKPEEKKIFPLTESMSEAIDRFFFHHYCQHFRSGAFARANCSIPMLNMCDDHDIIDGFGSYPDDLQRAPVFQRIGTRGYHFFLLFQCFINVTIDGIDDRPGQHIYKSLIIGGPGPYVRIHSHSFLSYMGPQCSILMIDCRAERKQDQVCSPLEYRNIFSRLQQLPPQVEHLVVQLGVPIAYPRMVFLEAALGSKLNPLVALGKSGQLGLSGFVNKFNADAELLDDLNDHWTARHHKQERNWLIQQFQHLAAVHRLRISFLSGDVHCAAVGVFKTLKAKNKADIPKENDFRYMINIVTSAIVNTPPPAAVLAMVSSLAPKTHKTLHHIETDETMLPIFSNDTNGSARKQKHVMGRRNWCQVDWDPSSGDLVFDLRIEKEKGLGTSVGYAVRVIPPHWFQASAS
ncbi:hypothetical protein AX17_005108 [Amanita inopinata Kibby_2008]|nr:hypothetical protein AX17_005108 [Amanita inopinata Kibby_2008]